MEQQPNGIIVKHSADKMRAYVALSKNFGPVTLGMLLREFIHKKIVHGLNTDVIGRLVASPVYDKYVEVAQGTQVKPGSDGRVEILVNDARGEKVGKKDVSFELSFDFTVVNAKTPVARRVPPSRGEDGMNIFGDPIVAPAVKDVTLKPGSGVVVSPDDPNVLVAEFSGVFRRCADGAVEVHPYMEVEGDLSAASGPMSFEGYLKVCGTIGSGASVDVGGALTVMGGVDAAAVKCGGDLTVNKSARGGAVIDCGGSVRAASLQDVKLAAEGSVTIPGDIVNSLVNCKGSVEAINILGGCVSAVCGISAVRVGGECGTHTILDVGAALNYAKERDALKDSVGTQNLLTEGYISELYCFVRDNMDEEGVIPEEKTGSFNAYLKNLTDSLTASRTFEENINKLEKLLEEAKNCCVSAIEVHPNVLLRLGFSEQNVSSVLKNIQLKPVGVK